MANTFRNSWNTFTAGEAEKITGVSATTQRDWRRRGFLESKGDGWTQHDLMDLARLTVMSALQDRGIGPALSTSIATSAALRISWFALNSKSAIEDNTGGKFERLVEKRKRPLASYFVNWTDSPGDPSRYLIAGPSNLLTLARDLSDAFDEASGGEGAAIVLDLKTLAGLIAQRAGRPLLSVEDGK